MNTHYSVRVPVKNYIKKYLQFLLGEDIVVRSENHFILCYLLSILNRERAGHYTFVGLLQTYDAHIVFHVPRHQWYKLGFDIPEDRVLEFNHFIESYFTETLYREVSYRRAAGMPKKQAIESFCDLIGITPDDVDYDSLRRKINRLGRRYPYIDRMMEGKEINPAAMGLFSQTVI